jgi:hypothetical protein
LILLAIHQGLVHPCFSEDILEEYAAVLARAKFAFPPDEIAAVLAMFHNQGELFQPDVSGPVSSDPADTKFLHCAQAARGRHRRHGGRDRRIFMGPIEPRAGEELYRAAIEARMHAVAVELDFVQPLIAFRRRVNEFGELRGIHSGRAAARG